jgi:Peptidase family M28
MIGYFNDEKNSQHYPINGMQYVYPDQGNFVAVVGRLNNFTQMRKIKSLMAGAGDLPVYSINTTSYLHGVDFSDHQSYWRYDFPAYMVTDTSFMRNQNYHQATDTFDTLDYARMAKVVQAVYAVVQQY